MDRTQERNIPHTIGLEEERSQQPEEERCSVQTGSPTVPTMWLSKQERFAKPCRNQYFLGLPRLPGTAATHSPAQHQKWHLIQVVQPQSAKPSNGLSRLRWASRKGPWWKSPEAP